MNLDGFCYRLRPVKRTDAQFIIDIRLEDAERNRFIHSISPNINEQKVWLERYFDRDGDFYFVIENRITGKREGLIAFYNEKNGKAEWGRWILKKGSLSAAESVYLLYRIAFEQVGLQELYCRTIVDNTATVSFHNEINELTKTIYHQNVELDGIFYDTIEHYSDSQHFYEMVAPILERQSKMVWRRQLKQTFGGYSFHHIGVATKKIEKELPIFTLLGYEREKDIFEDRIQGIRGQFMTGKNRPRLELLENLSESHTLNKQIEQNHKLYHIAYCVGNIEKAVDVFVRNRAKVISPMKISTFFGRRICFLILPNMLMIELIEYGESE